MAQRKLLLAGEWIGTPGSITVRNPYTGQVVAEVAKAGPAELGRAAEAAVRAFETTRRLSSGARSALLSSASAGLGGEGVRYAIEEMTQLRLLALNVR